MSTKRRRLVAIAGIRLVFSAGRLTLHRMPFARRAALNLMTGITITGILTGLTAIIVVTHLRMIGLMWTIILQILTTFGIDCA